MNVELTSRILYECLDCGRRTEPVRHGRRCSECGGYLFDISVPRHQ